MRLGRFFFKIGAWWLLVAAAAHSVGHYLFYIDESRFTPERLDVARRMQELVADPVLDGSLWRMLQVFSLSFGLFMIFAGVSSLVLLRGKPSGALLQRMAHFNAIFWGGAFVLVFLIYPMIEPLIIAGLACLLFGLSRVSLSGKKVREMPGGNADPGTEDDEALTKPEDLEDMDDISVEELLGEEAS